MMRDFSTISPSAKSIILMKGHTTIAYAKEVAQLISLPELFQPDFSPLDFTFWSKVFHFESRYLGINQLLEDLEVSSYLELSAGFNLRCLEISKKTGKPSFDTDLPEVVEEKKRVVESLLDDADDSLISIVPLNVQDVEQFKKVLSEMPPGPVAIINEGLLVYFDREEKEKLCSIVREVLAERDGYWITSDIDVRAEPNRSLITKDKSTKALSDRHRIEANKFSSLEEAKDFFERNGFSIDKEDSLRFAEMSSFRYLSASIPESMKGLAANSDRLQRTWRLRARKDGLGFCVGEPQNAGAN